MQNRESKTLFSTLAVTSSLLPRTNHLLPRPQTPALIQHNCSLGCCGHCAVIRTSSETSTVLWQGHSGWTPQWMDTKDTTRKGRVVEIAALPAQRFMREKKKMWKGIKPSRSKQGGEIGQLITIEDMPQELQNLILLPLRWCVTASKGTGVP